MPTMATRIEFDAAARTQFDEALDRYAERSHARGRLRSSQYERLSSDGETAQFSINGVALDLLRR